MTLYVYKITKIEKKYKKYVDSHRNGDYTVNIPSHLNSDKRKEVENLSNIIKGLRNLKGFNQEDVAKELKMASKTYWKKENNPNLFTVYELKKLSSLLEVKEEIFFKDKVTITVT